MSVFGNGKKHKRAAEAYLRQANAISDYQEEIEFRRQLLSNIRQERIARAQLQVRDYSPYYKSSTNEGFVANIDSSLAGEVDYSYSSSIRQQQMTDLVNKAQQEYKKYQKQTQRRATAFSVTGLVVGALTGGITGAQIGQGIGQIASNTGQWQTGIQNILSGATQALQYKNSTENMNKLLEAIKGGYNYSTTPMGYNRYEAISLDKNEKMMFNTAEQILLPQPNGTNIKGIRGYY